VFLLAQTRIVSFAGRVGFVLVVGILAAITTNVSYWNWYGFPGAYTASYMLIQIIGFSLVGVVAALLLPKRAPAA
jgi:mannose/fructose/N-acetylgalactosamine-specific phosphotransferase system component IIC